MMYLLKKFFWFLVMCFFGLHGSDSVYLPFDSKEYFPMEASTDDILLGGSRVGQLIQGSLTLVPGIHGSALELDGSSIIDLGTARSGCFLTPDQCPNGFTLAFWLYDDGAISSRNVYYISSGGQTYGSYGVAVLRNSNVGQLCVKTREEYNITDFELPTGAWVHVMITWGPNALSQGSVSKVYINGAPVGVNIQANQVLFPGQSNFNDIHLGAPNNVNDYLSNAKLDELLFWDEVKDATFVHHLYGVYTGPQSCSHCIFPHYFETKSEETVTAGVFITMTTTRNEVNCAMECLRHDLCLGVNWKMSTKTCELFSVVYGPGVSMAENNSYVLIKQ